MFDAPKAITFRCNRCNKPAQWEARRNGSDGRIDISVFCHGDRATLSLGLEMHGEVFPLKSVSSLLTPREGQEWVELVKPQP
jgi:hypothetical protein